MVTAKQNPMISTSLTRWTARVVSRTMSFRLLDDAICYRHAMPSIPCTQPQCRTFAKPAKQKQQQPGGRRAAGRRMQQQQALAKKKAKLFEKRTMEKKAAKDQMRTEEDRAPPPVFMTSTASPFVYIAISAAEDMIEAQESIEMTSSLFEGIHQSTPQYFSSSTFVHYTPHMLQKIQRELPEVAFLGRSNVGKSSLANAIMSDEKLCMTSKSPGRTQKEYYYGMVHNRDLSKQNMSNLATPLGWIVDLPGYGFAKAPDKAVDGWQASTQNWLQTRRDAGTLQRLYLLIDARRGVMDMDRVIMRWMDDAEIPYTIVITKIDRVALPQVIKIVNELCMRYTSITTLQNEQGIGDDDDNGGNEQHNDDNHDNPNYESLIAQSPVVVVTSSKQNMGLNELMHFIQADFMMDAEEEIEDEEEQD